MMKGTNFCIIFFFLILGPAWLGPYGSNVDANAVNLQAQGDPRQQTRPEEEILPIVEITWPRLGAEVSPIGFIVKGRVKNLLKSCKVVLLLDEHPVAGECSSSSKGSRTSTVWFNLALSPATNAALKPVPFFLFRSCHLPPLPWNSKRLCAPDSKPTNRNRFCIRCQDQDRGS
jgi:hypothetical protein